MKYNNNVIKRRFSVVANIPEFHSTTLLINSYTDIGPAVGETFNWFIYLNICILLMLLLTLLISELGGNRNFEID